MPIYAYRCNECGFAKDVLQKMSDPILTDCPSCGKPEFKKQVTAAGFQLKGSGWYATDFKGGSGGTSAPPAGPKDAQKTDSGGNESGTSAASTSTDTASTTSTTPAK